MKNEKGDRRFPFLLLKSSILILLIFCLSLPFSVSSVPLWLARFLPHRDF